MQDERNIMKRKKRETKYYVVLTQDEKNIMIVNKR